MKIRGLNIICTVNGINSNDNISFTIKTIGEGIKFNNISGLILKDSNSISFIRVLGFKFSIKFATSAS